MPSIERINISFDIDTKSNQFFDRFCLENNIFFARFVGLSVTSLLLYIDSNPSFHPVRKEDHIKSSNQVHKQLSVASSGYIKILEKSQDLGLTNEELIRIAMTVYASNTARTFNQN